MMAKMPGLPDVSRKRMEREIEFCIKRFDENDDNLVQPDEFDALCLYMRKYIDY